MSNRNTNGAEAGRQIMELLLAEVIRRLNDKPEELKAADFEFIRKLMLDNAVTISMVQKGDFGEFAQTVAQEFPFEEGDGSERYN